MSPWPLSLAESLLLPASPVPLGLPLSPWRFALPLSPWPPDWLFLAWLLASLSLVFRLSADRSGQNCIDAAPWVGMVTLPFRGLEWIKTVQKAVGFVWLGLAFLGLAWFGLAWLFE